jgi:hypothetical protein
MGVCLCDDTGNVIPDDARGQSERPLLDCLLDRPINLFFQSRLFELTGRHNCPGTVGLAQIRSLQHGIS